MKHFQRNSVSALTLLAVTALPLQLNASNPIVVVPWSQVCQIAHGNELIVTTAAGDAVEGFCVQINVNEIAVTTADKKVVKIARNTVSRLDMHRSKTRQLKSLRDGMRGGLRWGIENLFSPWAPVGVVAIPVTLVWGVMAAPFCLMGDLKGHSAGLLEIKPI